MFDKKVKSIYKYIDEAGDLTNINVGSNGVSKTFLMGMIEIDQSIYKTRKQILKLEKYIENNASYNEIPSVKKRIQKYGKFFFHAKDDKKEIREIFFNFLRKEILFFYEAVFIPKTNFIMSVKYDGMKRQNKVYADLLARLLKNKLNYEKIYLLISQKQSTTTRNTFEETLNNIETKYKTPKLKFTVKNPSSEPILSIVDYCNWTVQRVLERGETEYLNYLWDVKKILLIHDIFQATQKYPYNYYKNNNRLKNMVIIK